MLFLHVRLHAFIAFVMVEILPHFYGEKEQNVQILGSLLKTTITCFLKSSILKFCSQWRCICIISCSFFLWYHFLEVSWPVDEFWPSCSRQAPQGGCCARSISKASLLPPAPLLTSPSSPLHSRDGVRYFWEILGEVQMDSPLHSSGANVPCRQTGWNMRNVLAVPPNSHPLFPGLRYEHYSRAAFHAESSAFLVAATCLHLRKAQRSVMLQSKPSISSLGDEEGPGFMKQLRTWWKRL